MLPLQEKILEEKQVLWEADSFNLGHYKFRCPWGNWETLSGKL